MSTAARRTGAGVCAGLALATAASMRAVPAQALTPSSSNPYVSTDGRAVYHVIKINGLSYSQFGACPSGTSENDFYAPNTGQYGYYAGASDLFGLTAEQARSYGADAGLRAKAPDGEYVFYDFQEGLAQRTTRTAVVVGDCVPDGYHEVGTTNDGHLGLTKGPGTNVVLSTVGSTVKQGDGGGDVEIITHPSQPSYHIISFRAVVQDYYIANASVQAAYDKTVADGSYEYRAGETWNHSTGEVTSDPLSSPAAQRMSIDSTLFVTLRTDATPAQVIAAERAEAAKDFEITQTVTKPSIGSWVTSGFLVPTGSWDDTMGWRQAASSKPQVLVGNAVY